MPDFYKKLRNEYALKNRGLFTIPKIYDADGDMSKRWYVFFRKTILSTSKCFIIN